MWPWGHLGVGYLCYVAFLRFRGVRGGDDGQTLLTILAVGFGSQLPDLIDKPLGWTFGVLPSGRSLAHSLLTAAILVAVAYRLSRRYHRRDVAFAFGIGYVTHSLADLGPSVVVGLLRGDPSQLAGATYLLWPILPVPPPAVDRSLLPYILSLELEPYVWFQFGLFGVAIVVWIMSGTPGRRQVQRQILRWRARS